MKRLLVASVISANATAAIAHTSVARHEHPHGLSILPDLSVMLLAGVLVALGVIVFRKFGRRP